MKYLLCLLFLACLFQLGAQNYLNPTSTWRETEASCFYGTCTTSHFTISLAGDTTVNGKVYYKTLKSGTVREWDLSEDTLISETTFSYLHKLLREENGIFYRYHAGINNDIILADFNLNVGDTAVSSSCNNPLVVHHFDTLYLGTIPRKRFYFSANTGPSANTLIEGVGSTKGLFTEPCSEIGIEFGSSIDCFTQDEQYIQFDSIILCGQTVSTSQNAHPANHLTISPNPANDWLDILIDSPILTGTDIRIIDMQGKVLKQQVFPSFQNKVQVDISALPGGMYILMIVDGHSFLTSKWMKN